MKKIILLFMTAVLCVSLTSCKSENAKKVESMINSLGTITADSGNAISEAEKAYNELSSGDQSSVSNYDKLKDARKTFDSFKKVYAISESETAGKKTTYSDYEYNEKGLITSYSVSGYGTPGKYTNEYDEKGNLIKETKVSYRGTDVTMHEYDENGHETKLSYASDHDSIDNGKAFAYTYTFDDKGRVATQTESNLNADHTTVYSYTYNDDDTVATKTEASPSGTYTISYTYDENGNKIQEEAKGGKSTRKTTYKYKLLGIVETK